LGGGLGGFLLAGGFGGRGLGEGGCGQGGLGGGLRGEEAASFGGFGGLAWGLVATESVTAALQVVVGKVQVGALVGALVALAALAVTGRVVVAAASVAA
jgi:hypothetical protein